MKVFIIIDAQNDFIDGSLANKEAQKAIPYIKDYIQENVDEADYIFLTQDTHHEHYLETFEGKVLPVEHCIYKSDGWCINSDIAEICDDVGYNIRFITKPTFGSYNLITELKKLTAIGEIHICGFCTDICVISNALMIRAAFPDTHIYCPANCCAGVTIEKHQAALEVMKSCQIEVI